MKALNAVSCTTTVAMLTALVFSLVPHRIDAENAKLAPKMQTRQTAEFLLFGTESGGLAENKGSSNSADDDFLSILGLDKSDLNARPGVRRRMPATPPPTPKPKVTPIPAVPLTAPISAPEVLPAPGTAPDAGLPAPAAPGMPAVVPPPIAPAVPSTALPEVTPSPDSAAPSTPMPTIIPQPPDPALPGAPTATPRTEDLTPGILPQPEAIVPGAPKVVILDKALARDQRVLKARDIVHDLFAEYSLYKISVVEAVRMTLANNPTVELAAEDVQLAQASLKKLLGTFDTHVGFTADYDNRTKESTDKEKEKERSRARVNKELLKTSDILLEKIKAIEQGKADANTFNFDGTAFEDPNSQLNNIDPDKDVQEVDRVTFSRDQNVNALVQLLRSNFDRLGLPAATNDQAEQLALNAITDQKQIFKLLRKQAATSIREEPPWIVTRTQTYKYDIFVRKKFQNGPELRLYANMNGNETNFNTRGDDVRENRDAIGGKLSINILKLGIADNTTAQYQASREQLRAQEQMARAKIAREVLTSIQAYWRLAAAQERLLSLVQAELDTLAVSTLTKAMIDAKVLPAVDITQIKARELRAVADRYAGEIELATAQQALAIAIGINPEKAIVAPLAANSLPAIADMEDIRNLDFHRLYSYTVQNHPDLVAFQYLANADAILLEHTRRDLKPDLNAFIGGEFTGLNNNTGAQGYVGVLGSKQTGASVYMGASFDWPLENNAREGALLEAEAQSAKTRLREDASRRDFATQIALSRQKLLASARQADKLSDATGELTKAADIEREKLQSRGSTVLDLLTSEQALSQSRLAEVGARQEYAISLAQLRYSTFTLLPPHSYDEIATAPAGFRLTTDYFTRLPSTALLVHGQPGFEIGATPDFVAPRPLLDRLLDHPSPGSSASEFRHLTRTPVQTHTRESAVSPSPPSAKPQTRVGQKKVPPAEEPVVRSRSASKPPRPLLERLKFN